MAPLRPGSTIGILGGGQLGRMLALAAGRLGFDVIILSPEADPCAGRVAARTIQAEYDDVNALGDLAARCQVVTYEFENVPVRAVELLTDTFKVQCAPGARALRVAQDRVEEKAFVNSCGVPTVAFRAVDTFAEVEAALDALAAPALLKTRRQGYDGKGQTWVESHRDVPAAWKRIGGQPAILEAAADFVRELSVIAARSRDGEVSCYPLSENHHEKGVLRRTVAPAQARPATIDMAQTIAARILTGLDYVGVMGVELFEMADGKLLVNEIAPRVHNSGHWTLDGCEVDQFEQHIRAVAGWPLGPTTALAHVEMTNLLGKEIETWPTLAQEDDARLWLYGKGEARSGRKMGHVNRLRPLND